jgi:hypothetical protein
MREWWFQITDYMFWPIVAVWIMILLNPRERPSKEENDNGIIQPTGLPLLVCTREETVHGGDIPEAGRDNIDGDERVRDRPTGGLAEYTPEIPIPDPIPGSGAGN